MALDITTAMADASTFDNFPRAGRWDSVGLGCHTCKHFRGPPEWPDTKAFSACLLHRRGLVVELATDGYMEGEWLCHDCLPTKRANTQAVQHLERTRDNIPVGLLFRLEVPNHEMRGIPLTELPALMDNASQSDV